MGKTSWGGFYRPRISIPNEVRKRNDPTWEFYRKWIIESKSIRGKKSTVCEDELQDAHELFDRWGLTKMRLEIDASEWQVAWNASERKIYHRDVGCLITPNELSGFIDPRILDFRTRRCCAEAMSVKVIVLLSRLAPRRRGWLHEIVRVTSTMNESTRCSLASQPHVSTGDEPLILMDGCQLCGRRIDSDYRRKLTWARFRDAKDVTDAKSFGINWRAALVSSATRCQG
jgi:hypothetical protein